MITKVKSILRRKIRIRSKMGQADWRVSLNRSNRYLSAQLINTHTNEVSLGAIDKNVVDRQEKLTKTGRALAFGKWFGAKIDVKKVTNLVLDRGSCRYHGRIKAFTEGLRSVGVKI